MAEADGGDSLGAGAQGASTTRHSYDGTARRRARRRHGEEPEHPMTDDTIRAAGCVLWRRSPVDGELEICLVHRPKYDDWSHPKGKLKRGEDPLAGALREVEEETGYLAVPGSPLPTARYEANGRPRRSGTGRRRGARSLHPEQRGRPHPLAPADGRQTPPDPAARPRSGRRVAERAEPDVARVRRRRKGASCPGGILRGRTHVLHTRVRSHTPNSSSIPAADTVPAAPAAANLGPGDSSSAVPARGPPRSLTKGRGMRSVTDEDAGTTGLPGHERAKSVAQSDDDRGRPRDRVVSSM